MDVFRENAVELVGESGFVEHRRDLVRGGSTDMGDLSHIMPAIHPYTGGAVGMGHGTDYAVRDYEQAVIRPAKAMAMAAIDLLANGAAKGLEVLAKEQAAPHETGLPRPPGVPHERRTIRGPLLVQGRLVQDGLTRIDPLLSSQVIGRIDHGQTR